jgi:hypothetical protein
MDEDMKSQDVHMTPSKGQQQVTMGYITPPVTPNAGYFASDGGVPSSRMPITPTPQHQQQYLS